MNLSAGDPGVSGNSHSSFDIVSKLKYTEATCHNILVIVIVRQKDRKIERQTERADGTER